MNFAKHAVVEFVCNGFFFFFVQNLNYLKNINYGTETLTVAVQGLDFSQKQTEKWAQKHLQLQYKSPCFSREICFEMNTIGIRTEICIHQTFFIFLFVISTLLICLFCLRKNVTLSLFASTRNIYSHWELTKNYLSSKHQVPNLHK